MHLHRDSNPGPWNTVPMSLKVTLYWILPGQMNLHQSIQSKF